MLEIFKERKKPIDIKEEYRLYTESQLTEPDYTNVKPEIEVSNTGHNIVVLFPAKKNLAVKIYTRNSFEKHFKFLAIDTFSPYQDNRPKVQRFPEKEIREYKAIYYLNDKEVGHESEIYTIEV